MATTDPNAIRSTMMATPMPMASVAGSFLSSCASSGPKNSTPPAPATDVDPRACDHCHVLPLTAARTTPIGMAMTARKAVFVRLSIRSG